MQFRSKPSLAAVVGCMMPMMLGICFLCPSMDCLWHKYHYCPSCGEKVCSFLFMMYTLQLKYQLSFLCNLFANLLQVADFEKSDPCLVMDPPQWVQESFALPAWNDKSITGIMVAINFPYSLESVTWLNVIVCSSFNERWRDLPEASLIIYAHIHTPFKTLYKVG